MNTLHLLVAIDIAFACAVWYIYQDHKKKMDALYEKYDRDYKKKRDKAFDETDIIEMSDRK
jgi:hypothetical protein